MLKDALMSLDVQCALLWTGFGRSSSALARLIQASLIQFLLAVLSKAVDGVAGHQVAVRFHCWCVTDP